jgi:hypothetical protein
MPCVALLHCNHIHDLTDWYNSCLTRVLSGARRNREQESVVHSMVETSSIYGCQLMVDNDGEMGTESHFLLLAAWLILHQKTLFGGLGSY